MRDVARNRVEGNRPLQPEGCLDLAGQRLEYRMIGPGPAEAPTIVMLHEGLGCVGLWRDFPDRLAAATGCGVFVYSRQGYGGSSPCDLPRPVDYMHHEAQLVLPDLLQAIGFRRGFLLGHSDGGSIAAIHAGSVPEPGLLGVILIAPHFFAEDMCIQSIAAAAAAYRRGDLRRRLARYHGSNVDCAFNGWSGAWLDPSFRDLDLTGFLPRISAPVLMLQGEADQYGSAAQYEALRRECRAPVGVTVLADCGHAPHQEHPAETLAAIGEFVSRHLTS